MRASVHIQVLGARLSFSSILESKNAKRRIFSNCATILSIGLCCRTSHRQDPALLNRFASRVPIETSDSLENATGVPETALCSPLGRPVENKARSSIRLEFVLHAVVAKFAFPTSTFLSETNVGRRRSGNTTQHFPTGLALGICRRRLAPNPFVIDLHVLSLIHI